MTQKGTRVKVVRFMGGGRVLDIGTGTFVGHEVPCEKSVGMASYLSRLIGRKIPKIIMDCGTIVWGSEFYWGECEAMMDGLKRAGWEIEEASVHHAKTYIEAQPMTRPCCEKVREEDGEAYELGSD